MTSRDKSKHIKQQFPQILADSFGIVTEACRKANIARFTYYRWLESDPEFALLCKDAAEVTKDFVEGQLLNKIKQGDTPAIIFYCKTKLKERGYVERIEQTGKDGESLNQRLVTEEDERIMDRAIKRRMEYMAQHYE